MHHKYLTEILHYNPITGIFTWAISRPRINIGQIAGCVHKNKKYRYIEIDGKSYAAHRLAWFYVYKEFPKEQIDHINRIKDDNRIENLREATNAQNRANSKTNNKHEMKGVSYHPWIKNNPWEAKIRVNKKDIYLGCFPTKEAAHNAYIIAAKRYHGDFANP
jgi:hypothetical protein